jgi:hypothetical protein
VFISDMNSKITLCYNRTDINANELTVCRKFALIHFYLEKCSYFPVDGDRN